MEREMLKEIVKRAGRKYSLMNEIYTNTSELGQALSKNDSVSIQLLLEMRQESIDKFEDCEKELNILIGSLKPEEQDLLEQMMRGEETADTGEETKSEERLLVELSRNLRQQVKKTVELDRQISLRIAGKDSFYQK